MSKSTAVTAPAVLTEGRVQLVNAVGYRAAITHAAKGWGEGCALVVRVEPEEEAWRHSDFKHLFGHVLKVVSDYTGDTLHELKVESKALFYPEDATGRTSLTQLSREELRDFIEQVEQHYRQEVPDAFGEFVCMACGYAA